MPNKILIIEDEKLVLELIQKKLTNERYEVSVARDGEEGMEKMRKFQPDLVLLDIVMPKMDGFEVLEEMRKDKDLQDINVIVISNSGQPVELDRARELGANDWLVKAEFDPEEVVEKVKQQLQGY